MSPKFWSNTIWYILLLITSIITLIFTIKKSKHRRFTIAFTAATLGFVFYIESVVVIAFNAYAYHPGIVDDPFQETVLGNMFSQFSISSTSALTIVYGLSYIWYFVLALAYYVIEKLFIKLEVYELFTYKSVYTLIGFAPLFMLIKLWYRKLITSSKKAWHYITLYLSTNALIAVFFTMPLKVSKVQIYVLPFFEDASKNHTMTNLIYGFIVTPLFILVYKLKMHWVYKVLILGALFLFKYALYHAGIVTVIPGWFVPITLIEFAGRYALIALFDGFLKKKPLQFKH